MLEGRNFWELVEKRAARTPDDVMTVDEDDREITFGGYRDAALRAAPPGWPHAASARATWCRGCCPPGTSR